MHPEYKANYGLNLGRDKETVKRIVFPSGGTLMVTLVILMIITGCTGNPDKDKSGSDTEKMIEEEDYYHADDDIAMTIRSIADAISVGEPLDSIDYNYEGVLTDGQGRPLYTDIQGSPGKWDIDVLSPTSVVIRNLAIGDLLPDDLMHYLAHSLDLTDANILEVEESVLDNDDMAERVVYDFGGGYLRFDTRGATAMNGLEGPLMTITASKKKPKL